MTPLDATTSVEAWSDALARPMISPAGGSAASIAAAMAASLVEMVAGLALRREKLAAGHPDAGRMLAEAERLRRELLELAADDAQVLEQFGQALALPTTTVAERETREAAKRHALAEGARVQLDVLARATEITELAEDVARLGPPTALGDAATAVFLANAAARGAYWAARTNLEHDSEPARDALARAEVAKRRMNDLLAERIT